jgi:hypothetical protein
MSDSESEERGPESGGRGPESQGRPSDRRAAVRHLACFPAEIDVGKGPVIAIIRDLSLTGALLLTRARFKVGDAVKLSLYILDESNPRTVSGTIMRFEMRGSDYSDAWPHSAGIKFDESLQDCEAEIKAVAEQQARSGVNKAAQ